MPAGSALKPDSARPVVASKIPSLTPFGLMAQGTASCSQLDRHDSVKMRSRGRCFFLDQFCHQYYYA